MSGRRRRYGADAAFRSRLAANLARFDVAPSDPRHAGLRRAAVAVCVVAAADGDACIVVTERSGFLITPVVVWGPPAARLVPDPREVAAVHTPAIADLDRPPRFLTVAGCAHPLIQVRLLGEWLHAPTAAVLHQFTEVAVHGRPTRVADFEQPSWADG